MLQAKHWFNARAAHAVRRRDNYLGHERTHVGVARSSLANALDCAPRNVVAVEPVVPLDLLDSCIRLGLRFRDVGAQCSHVEYTASGCHKLS